MAPQSVLLIAVVGLAGLAVALMAILNPRTIQSYWQRSCTGRAWKRTFPDASKQEIRQFLYLFVEAFAFPKRRALYFAPTDRVDDIYRSLYPVKGWPDALELETFALRLEKSYGYKLRDAWRDDLTIGEIFSKTNASSLPRPQTLP